jgi:hypothetical protein
MLAGLGLGNLNSPTSFKIFLAGLQSHGAAEVIARDQNLMHRLFPDQWSDEDRSWHEPRTVTHAVLGTLRGVLTGQNGWAPPSADSVFELLRDRLTITDSRDSPIETVSIESSDRQLAIDLLRTLTSDVDRLERQRALLRANNNIEFLNQELQRVTVAEYRSTLVQHLYDQETTRMLASANNVSFAADVVGGPTPSPKPTSPSPIATFIAALVVGTVIGFLLALYYESRGMTFAFGWPPISRPHPGMARRPAE